MNLRITQRLRKSPRPRRAPRLVRAFTAFALMTFLFTASSVQAGPITIKQVGQTVNSIQGPVDLRLNSLVQDPKGSPAIDAPRNDGSANTPASGDGVKIDQLLSGFPVVQDPQKLGVEVIEEAEVEGTICDCGDILLPTGGFPKWPFLFLAAVPLVFIHDCETCNDTPSSTPTPTPPPNPTPTPVPTPEPASLLLFGTGLLAVGAGLRRRYTRTKAEQVNVTTEEE
jgi:PEP-CTERM motif-containing protein